MITFDNQNGEYTLQELKERQNDYIIFDNFNRGFDSEIDLQKLLVDLQNLIFDVFTGFERNGSDTHVALEFLMDYKYVKKANRTIGKALDMLLDYYKLKFPDSYKEEETE